MKIEESDEVMLTDKKPQRASAAHKGELRDEALNQTFPASDPVAIDIERGVRTRSRCD
jgi:hypothetical protein